MQAHSRAVDSLMYYDVRRSALVDYCRYLTLKKRKYFGEKRNAYIKLLSFCFSLQLFIFIKFKPHGRVKRKDMVRSDYNNRTNVSLLYQSGA